MLKLRAAMLLILASSFPAFSADPSLLRLVMPDAKVIAGIQVQQARNSLFGQFVLSHMAVDDESFKNFMAQTGFDPRRDLNELLIASNWQSATPENRWLVLANGVFNLPKIAATAQANGGTITNFLGVEVLTYSPHAKPDVENAVAFFDSSSAVMGDLVSVKAAIQRQKSNAPPSGDLLAKVRDVSAKNDFWFVTLVPVSEFAGAMPDQNLSGAMKGNLLAAINQASGGVRFGDTVTISAEAITRSDKDALALVDVVKFVAGLLQMNRQNNPAAGQVATLLDSLDCKAAGNITTLSLAIPERQLEQLLDTFRQEGRQARKQAAPRIN